MLAESTRGQGKLLLILHSAALFSTHAIEDSETSPVIIPYERRQLLHESLLDEYDFTIPPNYPEVEVSINFFKYTHLDLQSSTLHFSAWFRLSWTDERLSWNDTAWSIPYTTIQAESGSLENSLVWTPDIELYNNEDSIDNSFRIKPVTVYPSGWILWSRPGKLQALCIFSGLYDFPFDTIECQLEFGAWTLDGTVQDIKFRASDGGYNWPGKEGGTNAGVTAGSAFQDYHITGVRVERKTLYYHPYPEPWPELLYTVQLKRSTSFYWWKLVLPQVSMGVLSFIPYFMNPDCGERLGFGITLVLAILTTDVVLLDLVPRCNEVLFMDYITRLSLMFCFLSLMESAVVLWTFYLTVGSFSELLPRWCHPRRTKKSLDSLEALFVKRKGSDACVHPASDSADRHEDDSGAKSSSDVVTTAHRFSTGSSAGGAFGSTKLEGKFTKRKSMLLEGEAAAGEEEGKTPVTKLSRRVRVQLYRQAFYILDEDYSGRLEPEEINKFGSFMLGDEWTDQLTSSFMKEADLDQSGSLSFNEFATFCESKLLDESSKDLSYINQMIKGFISMMQRRQEQLKAMWQYRAICIDKCAQWMVPPFYFVFLLTVFAADVASLSSDKS
jgi:hypothetical protein